MPHRKKPGRLLPRQGRTQCTGLHRHWCRPRVQSDETLTVAAEVQGRGLVAARRAQPTCSHSIYSPETSPAHADDHGASVNLGTSA